MRDIAEIMAEHYADRAAHTPSIFVRGPGCLVGGRGFISAHRRYAVQLRDRLNAEHGPGTHTITG